MDRVAIALVPTIIRAYSMIWNICAMPSCTSPSSVPTAGRRARRRCSSQVVETLRPILCSTLVTKTPLRSPSSPGLRVERGTSGRGTATGPWSPAAGPGALRPGQHEVDDVLGQVVLAGGDEALHAVDVPGAVRLRDGLGAAGADVGAGVGLGEHHRRAPAALDHELGPAPSAPACRGGARSRRSAGPRSTCTPPGWRRGPARRRPTARLRGTPGPPSSAGRSSRHHSPSHSAGRTA